MVRDLSVSVGNDLGSGEIVSTLTGVHKEVINFSCAVRTLLPHRNRTYRRRCVKRTKLVSLCGTRTHKRVIKFQSFYSQWFSPTNWNWVVGYWPPRLPCFVNKLVKNKKEIGRLGISPIIRETLSFTRRSNVRKESMIYSRRHPVMPIRITRIEVAFKHLVTP